MVEAGQLAHRSTCEDQLQACGYLQTDGGSDDLRGGGARCNLGEQGRGGETFTFITGARFASAHMT